jgi:hypothetical protein
MPDAHGTKPHVKIGKSNPKQTHPRPKHVATIETTNTAIDLITRRRLGELIDKAADEMAQRMTAERVAA